MARADHTVSDVAQRDSLIVLLNDRLAPGLSVYCIDTQTTYELDDSLRRWIKRDGSQAQHGGAVVSLADYCSSGTSAQIMAANVAGFSKALAALTASIGGILYIPAGKWHFNAPITNPNWDHITIEGEGYDTSTLNVHGLTAGQIFLDATNNSGNQVLYCRIKQLTIYGTGVSGATAIRQSDWESGEIDARIWFVGNKSIGIDLRGRELVKISAFINADLPIVVHSNPRFPGWALGLDHYTFRDLTLYGHDNTESVFTVIDSCDVAKTTWEGRTAIVTDGGGLDFSGARNVSGCSIGNIRHESLTGEANMQSLYTVNLSPTNRADHVTITNVQGGHYTLKLRRTVDTTLIGCSMQGLAGGVALDADGTNDRLTSIGFFGSGGAWNVTGLVPVFSSHPTGDGAGNSIPGFVVYVPESLDLVHRLGQTGSGVFAGSVNFTLAKAASVTLGALSHPANRGTITVMAYATEIDATIAEGMLGLSVWGPFLLRGSANFASTNTASKLCVYVDGADIKASNNTARDLNVTIAWN
jgi:hypothetical protein